MGLISIGGCALTLNFFALGTLGLISETLRYLFGRGLEFSNPLFVDLATRPRDAILMLLGGCVSGFPFAYGPLLEFGTRARPIAVDDGGVSNFLFGMRLRLFPWSQVRKFVKLRARHPLGYNVEFVRIFSNTPAADSQRRNKTASFNATAGWLKLLPREEIWLPSYVDHKSFPTACDILSYYAQLHHIPMEFWDMTPGARQLARKQGKSQIIGVSVDHL